MLILILLYYIIYYHNIIIIIINCCLGAVGQIDMILWISQPSDRKARYDSVMFQPTLKHGKS